MNGKLRNMAALYILCKDKILLLYRQGGKVVNNVWVASSGGHFEKDELNNAKSCVLRELKEELRITEKEFINFELRYIALKRTNGEIRQNYYFFAEIEDYENLDLSSNEGILQWFDISEVHSLDMPYSAKFVVEHYINKGKYNDKLYCGVADGNKVVFTEMPEYMFS